MKKYLTITILTGVMFVIAGILIFQSQRIATLERTVEEISLGALCQSAEEMETLALTMEKALLSTDPAHTLSLLHSAGQTAGIVQQCLSSLPLSQAALTPVMRFTNQLSAHAAGLLPRLFEQEQLSPEETAWLNQQLALCSQLSSQLAMADSLSDLENLHLDSLPGAASGEKASAKGLPQGEITQEEALSVARDFVGGHRCKSIQAAPGTSGALAAYGVTVQTDDLQLNLEITRQGGKVLWMMPETASFPVTQSPAVCHEAALAFLELQGFAGMEPVHYQIYDGLCVISLVPTQNDVLLYPDLIRIQVRMDTAEIVGLEAHNYWLNHTRRDFPPPSLTADEALAHLGSYGKSAVSRLCLIPHNGAEALCYEITLQHNGETYLIYLDAQSGREMELLKTITVENGFLTA